MVKSIIKEIFIVILLCVAIILVLGVVFYDSMPNNKIVPNKIEAYETPSEVKAEVEEKVLEETKIEQTYQITEQDLKVYKQNHSYSTGKVDPFLVEDTNTNTNGGNNSNNNSNNNNGSSNSSTNNSGNPNITKPGRPGLK